MKLIEEVHSKLTVLSVREWESFQTILRSLGRRSGLRARKEKAARSGGLSKKFVGAAIMMVMLFTFTNRTEAVEDTGEVVSTMAEVVVTATRGEQDIQKIPATVSVITAKDIAASNATTVPDVLRLLPGVIVRDIYGNGNDQSIDMGGFGETATQNVAIVLNGRRINSIDMGTINWARIPVENIERIEVLDGSGAVLYGDNAMGGVINIITKEATEEGIQYKVNFVTGSYDTLRGSALVDFVSGPLSINSGITHNETDGYRDHSDSSRDAFFMNLRFDPSSTTSIFSEISLSKSDYQFPGSLSQVQMVADRTQMSPSYTGSEGADNKGMMFIGGVEQELGGLGSFRFELSYDQQESESFIFVNMTYDVKTLGITPKYVLDHKLGSLDNRITLGLDYYDTDYENWVSFTDQNDIKKKTIAGYIQDEMQIYDSLMMNIGFRYEKVEFELNRNATGNSKDEDETACNLGLSYAWSLGSKVYAKTYSSYRYPVVDEYMDVLFGTVNTTLKPQSSRGYEVGGNWMVINNLEINFRASTFDVDDEIIFDSATFTNVNIDTSHEEFDLGFKFQPIGNVSLIGGVSYFNVKFAGGVNDGNRLPLVPEWQGNVGLSVKPMPKLNAKLQYNYVGGRYFGSDGGNQAGEMEDYDTVDLFVNYKLNTNITFIAEAKNLFSEKYSEYAYAYNWLGWNYAYYPMPEANYYAGVRMSF